jgi:hypothetical protein
VNPASEFPEPIDALPIDGRWKLPIPAVTARRPDGQANFSIIDGAAAFRLATQGRCSVCAQPFENEVAFLGSPEAVTVGAYHDPPMHESCAEASTRLCPHIARRDMRRRPDRRSTRELPVRSSPDKPGRWVMWISWGFGASVVNAMLIFLPAPYTRLRTFTYNADGQLHETFDTTPDSAG